MKRFAMFFLTAMTGGFMAMGIYHYFGPERQTAITVLNRDNAYLAGNKAREADALPDLTYAAEKSVQGVVNIQTVQQNYQAQQYDPFRDLFFDRPYQREPSRVMGQGSGVIVSDDGYIVTNNHVVNGADEILVTLNDKRSFPAEVIGVDPTTDLALIKIDEHNLTMIQYGNSDLIRTGEWVLAVGNPFNLNSTVTAGIISAKGRNINILNEEFAIESFIQTDAAVNPGNSGGALVDRFGNLIGINTAIKSNTGSYAGYSFAVPVNIVKKVIDDLLKFGTAQRAFIGVSIQDMNAALAEELGEKEISGIYVAAVLEGGAAKDAGIEEGDIITKVGDITVGNVPELQEQIGRLRPGDKIDVTVRRDGRSKSIRMILKNKEGNTNVIRKPSSESVTVMGAVLEPVDAKAKHELKINNGLLIKELKGGKFRSAGIREGFIITKIDHKDINSTGELQKILASKKAQEGVLIEGIYPNGLRAYYGFGI
ncbi:MAG: Do family serine endopeptidase [Flavobacteriales bacterium]|nr:Do family serine endopeptidase [Flavobacteriales bacterium]